MVDFAQDLLRVVLRMRADRGTVVTVRVGIASGLVLAGIVGETRLTFDVWGEVVDLAKAIAAEADANAIMVSDACHDLLHDLYRFDPPVELALSRNKAVAGWPLRREGGEHEAAAGSPARSKEAPHV